MKMLTMRLVCDAVGGAEHTGNVERETASVGNTNGCNTT
jgi:hypothetical protein